MKLEIQPFLNVRRDKAQALKPLEEAAEVFGAWQGYDGPDGGMRLLDECMDVIQATVNLLYAYGYSTDAVELAATRCRNRNTERGRRYTEWD